MLYWKSISLIKEEQVYATWFGYGIITYKGGKKEVLSYKIPSWSSTSGVNNRADFAMTSSPYTGGKKLWISVYGADTQGIGASESKSTGGARPVLHAKVS